jgi:predicted heme/steroid binding protein
MHQGIQMGGTDATAQFASSPHSLSILEGMPVVGTFSSTTNETNPTLPVFTPTTLAVYDGKNGSPAYVAVQGIVYDLTSVFVNGMHQGIQMGGTDATVHFESSPHSLAILEGMPVVGTFSSTTNETNPTLPVFTLAQLSQYTGAGGTTAYVAVNGVVYDVTNAFTNGTHRGIQLGGTDATTIFASSPHSQSLLDSLPIVGSLEGAPTIPSGQGNTQTGGGTEEEDEDEWEDEDHVNLPQAILDYLAAQYPTATIREAEWEDGHYEVELNNGLELKFDQNGQFLSAEWDD